MEIEIASGGLNTEGYPCWASIYEMSVKGTEGGNYALNQLCVASTAYSHGASVAAAFDKNYSTRYCASNADMPQQIVVDLGNQYDIGAVYLLFEQLSDWDYRLETSVDGTSWDTFAEPGVSHVSLALHQNNTTARYVRLTVKGTSGGAWASVYEMAVYSYPKEEKEAKEAATKVDEKIAAIGEVTLDSEKAIQEARAAYDDLDENAKGYVTKLADLEAAEKKLAELKASQTPSTGGSVITPGEDKQETGTQTGIQTGRQTGDNVNVVLYLATLFVAAFGIIFFVRAKRKARVR